MLPQVSVELALFAQLLHWQGSGPPYERMLFTISVTASHRISFTKISPFLGVW
jgi:hypothetical protein